MKKRNYKEDNHYYVQWGIAALILMVYVVATLISYNNKMGEQSKDRVLSQITKQAVEIRGFYEGRVTANSNMMKSLGNYIAKMDDITSDEAIELISEVKESNSMERIFIIDDTGHAIDDSGLYYEIVDTSDKIQQILEGKNDFIIYTNLEGNTVMVQAVPIQKDNKVYGYLVIEQKAKAMNKVIDFPIYSYSIIYKDGLVAENLGDDVICEVGKNILDTVKSKSFEEGTYTTFSQAITGGRSTSVMVTINKSNYYLVTQPITNTDSEIIVIARSDIIERTAREENSNTRTMVLKLLVSLIAFIALIAIIYIINRLAFSKTSMELQNKAETDLLTDLLNKISTEKKIEEYLSSEGKDKTCMMCVLDIDNFKKINDTMGHAFGDEVLAALGKQIRSEFRVSDIIGRTGGDEFIIFLKDLKDDTIINREAERVENFFRNFTVGEYTKYSATASIGAAIYPRDAQDFESLYKAADSALYKAKNRGKNQLAFYRESNK